MDWDTIFYNAQKEVMEELKAMDDDALHTWWNEGTPADKFAAVDFFFEHGEDELAKRCKRLGFN